MEASDEGVDPANDSTTGLISEAPRPQLTGSQAARLYVSHALSTWNARGYEFAAILFTAAAYPNTLTAAALRMLIIYIAMVIFSSSVGQWVQRSPDRLKTLLTTVVINRASVIIGSFVWLLILSQEDLAGPGAIASLPVNHALKHLLFAVAIPLGIIERLSASGNMISMERDWVVTVAAPAGQRFDLTRLNAVMRRIDLVCKLISPIVISVVISSVGSTRVGVVYTGLTSLISLPIEAFSARRVWRTNPLLKMAKSVPDEPAAASTQTRPTWTARLRKYIADFEEYFSESVWIPSVALCMLHFNMMTWRATFITYLISKGYSLNVITLARAFGSIFEVTSTVATPWGISHMGKAYHHAHDTVSIQEESSMGLLDEGDEEGRQRTETLVGLQRFGLWGLSWLVTSTIPVLMAIWAISSLQEPGNPSTSNNAPFFPWSVQWNVPWSLTLFIFLAMSRFGVWVYDLTTTQLSQTLVPETRRSSFAGVENSVINIFEVLGAGAAVAFPKPEYFKWLSLASFVMVVMSWTMYAYWVRKQRGHLLHLEKLGSSMLKLTRQTGR